MSYKLQGFIDFQGLQIAIENKKGSIRSGIDADGTKWKTKLTIPYGYIKKTEGTDGDEVDCFIGDNKESKNVFVIHTQNPETGEYDEDKVMLGFDTEQQAKDAFNQNYDSPCYIHDTTKMNINELKEKLKIREGKMLKAVRELKAFFKGKKIKDLTSLDLFAMNNNDEKDIFTGKTITKNGKTYTLKTSAKDPSKRRYMSDEQLDIFSLNDVKENKPETESVEPIPQAKTEPKKEVKMFNETVDLFAPKAETKKPIKTEKLKDSENIKKQENKPKLKNEELPEAIRGSEIFRGKLLGRLVSDCEQYVKYDNKNIRFWAGNPKDQIRFMEYLWDSLPKPVYAISKEGIEEYKRQILGDTTKGEDGKKPEQPKEQKEIKPVRGKKTRERLNESIKELLSSKKDSDFKEDEKNLIRSYSGRGGLDLEVDDISLNEFYTLPFVTQAMWDSLKTLGFKGGRVLEPSCATGLFIDSAPDNVIVTGIEMDKTSGRIANILHGDKHDIQVKTFEEFNENSEGGEFDAVIGNCPFGGRGVSAMDDPAYRKLDTHEEYFLQRGIDDLKEGGLLAMIVPTSIMDNASNNTFRLNINKQAEFLGAVRMPTGAFKHANANVTTDIVYFRKRPNEIVKRMNNLKEGELDKLFNEMILDSEFIGGTYFEKNQDYALGEEKEILYGRKIRAGELNEDELRETINLLKPHTDNYAAVFGDKIKTEVENYSPQVGDIKIINGRVYRFNENHRWERVNEESSEAIPLSEELQKYGIKDTNELSRIIQDPALLWDLDKNAFGLIGNKLTDRIEKELKSYPAEAYHREEMYKKLIILGLFAKDFQKQLQDGKLSSSEIQMKAEKIKGMFRDILNAYGNPHELGLSKLLGKTVENPFMYILAMLNKDGEIHRILDEPLSFFSVYHPSGIVGGYEPTDLQSIVRYLFENEMPANLEAIEQLYKGDKEGLERKLIESDEIFINENGYYAPMSEVCMGEIYNKIGSWERMQEELKNILKDTTDLGQKNLIEAKIEKLDNQALEIRKRAGTKDLDELPVLMRDAKLGMFSLDTLNDYLLSKLGSKIKNTIIYDNESKIFTLDGELIKEAYLLYLGKGSNSKSDTDRLKHLIEKLYGFHETNPFEFSLLNYLNNTNVGLRAEKKEEFANLINEIELNFRSYLKLTDSAIEIQEKYNKMYNGYIHKNYDSKPIEGLDFFDYDKVISYDQDGNPITARDKAGEHTWETVRRMYEQGKGMIAHGVGLGKTLEGILLALLHKHTGKAKNPLVVCPKSVLKNWYDEINKWTKDTKVLVIGLKQDSKGEWTEDTAQEKQLKLMEVANNKSKYDIILMSRDTFRRIDFSKENKQAIVNEMINKNYPIGDSSKKEVKSKKEGAAKKLMESLEPIKIDAKTGKVSKVMFQGVTLENLGIDLLIRDEAHDTKNLLVPVQGNDIAGLSSSDSQRSIHNYIASKIIRSQNNEKGYYALTATPISNSPLEVMNMLLPFSEVELNKMGIGNMDEFIKTFATIGEVPVTDTDTKIKIKRKFVGWSSPEALRNLFFRFTDYRTKDTVQSVKANIKFPKEVTNRITSELNEGQKKLMQDCIYRLYTIKYRQWNGHGFELNSGKISDDVNEGLLSPADAQGLYDYFQNVSMPLFEELNEGIDVSKGDKMNVDVYFKVQTDMIKIAGDLEWYKDSCTDYATKIEDEFLEKHKQTEKMKQVTESVATLYKEGKKQIIFAINVSLHDKIKDELIKAGIKEKEICIVNGKTAKDPIKRKKISDAYNSGEYKVIIGNYATMGEGLNFNNMTSDIHHLQPTWNYLQLEQGNGRGIRQGNPLDFVNTHYYLSAGSIDSFMLNKIFDKGGMVDKFMKGEISTWDDEVQADGDELLIALSGNPEQAKLLKDSRDRVLQKAMKAKNRNTGFKDFQKFFEKKQQLALYPEGSKYALSLQKEINELNMKIIMNKDFDYEHYLGEKELPLIFPDLNQIIPLGTIFKDRTSNRERYISVKSYTPSTGRIELEIFEDGIRKSQNSKIDIFKYAIYNKDTNEGTMERTDFGMAEIFRKQIMEGKIQKLDYAYKLPKDILQQHKQDIVKSLIKTAHFSKSVFLVQEDNGRYTIERAKTFNDSNYDKVIFPQTEPNIAQILDNLIKNSDSATIIDGAEQIAEDIYGSNYEKEMKKILRKDKASSTKEFNAEKVFPKSGTALIKKLDSLIKNNHLKEEDKRIILYALEKDPDTYHSTYYEALEKEFRHRNKIRKDFNHEYQFHEDYTPSQEDLDEAEYLEKFNRNRLFDSLVEHKNKQERKQKEQDDIYV